MVDRVFVDMDGVSVDFEGYMALTGLTAEEVKHQPGAYRAMLPIPGAIEAIRSMIAMGHEVWVATKPPTAVPNAYSDKVQWILEYLPELKRRIIITHDKGLLGDAHDYLCDDRPHRANCERFPGTLLPFVDGFHWPQALAFFRDLHMQRIAGAIESFRLDLSDEKRLQADLEVALQAFPWPFEREKNLSSRDIPDFFFASGLVIECKLRPAQKMAVFRQLERYASHQEVTGILLASNLSMTLPEKIHGKPAMTVSLSKGWL